MRGLRRQNKQKKYIKKKISIQTELVYILILIVINDIKEVE